MQQAAVGRMALYKTPWGDRPFIITVIHSDTCVNGRVVLDVNDPRMQTGMMVGLDSHVTSIMRGFGIDQWRFYDD